jgi:hypothetical protein
VPESFRRASCCHCSNIFEICSSCDRGQIYCSAPCRRAGVAASRRRAGRRHQASREGRLDHRDRQRRYRSRQRAKLRDANCVTHMGSKSTAFCGTQSATPAVPCATEAQQLTANEDTYVFAREIPDVVFCAACGREAQFVHYDFRAVRPPPPPRRGRSVRDDN